MRPDIFFDPESHTYLVDGTIDAPSVTTILDVLFNRDYKTINPFLLEQAARRGTAVHEYCEAFDYDILPEQVESEVVGYVQAYVDFMRDYRCVWEQIESPVYSYRYGFAGTIDRAGIIDNKESILDIKTIASPTKMNKFAVCMQTAAYAVAREETYGVETKRRYALYLNKNGDYSLMNCQDYELKYSVDSFSLFKQCLDLLKTAQTLKDLKPTNRKGQ